MRFGIVIQSSNVPEREGQVHSGFAVGRVEGAILGGILIDSETHVKGLLDVGHPADELQVPAVTASADNFKAARLGECDQGIPIFLARAKPLGDLLGREELLV
jgi:hypothetical protein